MTERTYTILSGEGEDLEDSIRLAGIFPMPEDTVLALTVFDGQISAENRLVAVARDGDGWIHRMPERDTVH